MADDLSFDSLKLETTEPVEEVAPVEEPVTPAVAEPIEVTTPVEHAPEEVSEKPEVRTVPLPTFLDQRDELKETKRRLAEYEARNVAPAQAPDPFDDPEGFANHRDNQMGQMFLAQKFSMSGIMARKEFGDDLVEAAVKWADQKLERDPTFRDDVFSNAHPVDWIVRQHKRDGFISQIGNDPDDYVRRRAAELGLIAPVATAPAVAVQQRTSTTPTRSLAATPSIIGGVDHVAIDPLGALRSVFK